MSSKYIKISLAFGVLALIIGFMISQGVPQFFFKESKKEDIEKTVKVKLGGNDDLEKFESSASAKTLINNVEIEINKNASLDKIVKDLSVFMEKYGENTKTISVNFRLVNLSRITVGDAVKLAISLKKVKKLNLDYTSITTPFLVALLRETKSLEKLNLEYVSLKGLTVDQAKELSTSLKNVKELNLNRTKISSSFLVILIKGVSSLESLYIDNVDLKNITIGDAIIFSKSINKVKNLHIQKTNIAPSFLVALVGEAKSLKELNLYNIDLKNLTVDQAKAIAPSLKNLKWINLTSTHIAPSSIVALLRETKSLGKINLELLNLKGIKEEESNALSQLFEKLKTLTFSYTDITPDSFVSLLKGASSLENLCVDRVILKNLTAEQAKEIAPSLKNLKKGSFTNTHITTSALVAILKETSSLEELILASINLKNITVEEAKEIAPKLKNVEKLTLNLVDILPSSLVTLLGESASLKFLHLLSVSIENLTKDKAKEISTSIRNLKELSLYNAKIIPSCLVALLSEAVSLESLDLEGINLKNLSAEQAKEIAPSFKHLKEIYLFNTHITTSALVAILSEATSLEFLFIGASLKDLTIKKAKSIAPKLKNLKRLGFSYTHIAPSSIVALLSEAVSLENLGLASVNLERLTVEDAAFLGKSLNRLNWVNLRGTKISEKAFYAFKRNLPRNVIILI